jgi:hypothetical protein
LGQDWSALKRVPGVRDRAGPRDPLGHCRCVGWGQWGEEKYYHPPGQKVAARVPEGLKIPQE